MNLHVLVLVTSYPTETCHDLMYVHVRNKYYQKNGIDVTVLNFSAKKDYEYENIKVITLDSYKHSNSNFDVLVSHASNIRYHYRFINKYENRFKRIIFFYHGHEIQKLNEVYPEEYFWIKKSPIKRLLQSIYDIFKLFMWRKKLEKIIYKSELVFVSNWLYYRFLYYVHINPKFLVNHVHIINNSIGEVFEKKSFDYKCKKKYDFITIRGNALDKSEHAIDVVNNLALCNEKMKFLIVGMGKFYDKVKKPDNVEFINGYLKHDEMIDYLNQSRCALLPTRHDTQGVMTCELASYCMPTITSNIDICQEIFSSFKNVALINNEEKVDLNQILKELEKGLPYEKNELYFSCNTIKKEVDLIKNG